MDRQQPESQFEQGFRTRTLIRVHFVAGLVAAAVAGKVADSLGYNSTPWAFGAAGATVVVFVIWIVARRINSRRTAQN
jgi:hypothetical protein